MNRIESKYGFKLGQVYTLNCGVFDEYGKYHDIGTRVRIVAITPKVRIVEGHNKDTKEYFYNAVPENQVSNYGSRIRENFCTLLKTKRSK